jgi:hypothetical protein
MAPQVVLSTHTSILSFRVPSVQRLCSVLPFHTRVLGCVTKE